MLFLLESDQLLKSNVENQNIEGSERQKYLLGWSERRNIWTSKIRTSKDQNVKNQNVEKNVESLKMTFDVLIFLDAIGNIRTSKVL
jgi:hypothetical protein